MGRSTALDPASIDKGLGALLGALIGSALGGPLDGLGRAPTQREVDKAMGMPGGGAFALAPGQVAGGGELTLVLMDALAGASDYPLEAVARGYVDWAISRPFDIDIATNRALRDVAPELGNLAGQATDAALKNNQHSKANGCLKRLVPIGVWGAGRSKSQSLQAARLDARLTHPSPACQFAGAAYVAAIRQLVADADGHAEGAIHAARLALIEEEERDQGQSHEAGLTVIEGMDVREVSPASEVRQWLDEALAGRLPACWPQAGFVRIAFAHAFFHLSRESDMKTAMRQVLGSGGDTDANASVVAGLVGARIGASETPGFWRNWVTSSKAHAGRQPRPAPYTPFNLDERVVRLLS